jgi:hypothetical protein
MELQNYISTSVNVDLIINKNITAKILKTHEMVIRFISNPGKEIPDSAQDRKGRQAE